MDFADSSTLTIVGGGLTGGSIAAMQARHHAVSNRACPFTIRLIDRSGCFGPGLPYDCADDVFWLNQPACAMSPFPDDPDHFTRWLGSVNGQATGDEFATRRQYGDYLKETLAQHFADAAAPVRLETIHAHVDHIDFRLAGATLRCAGGRTVEARTLVLATGHQKNDFLSHLDGNPHYFAYPYTARGVGRALGPARQDVVIIGTGQSMLDALALLDDIGWRGTIHAVSRHTVEPWAFHPEHYRVARPPYRPLHLDAATVKTARLWDYPALAQGLKRDIDRARGQGYDIGHVLCAIDFTGLANAGPDGGEPEGLPAFRALWAQYYGGPTPPARHALYETYRRTGRLAIHKGEVRGEDIEARPEGFHICLRTDGGDRIIDRAVLFNAASLSRNPLASPLLRQADRQGVLAYDGENLRPGRQGHPCLFVSGPAVSAGQWGVETFRDNNAAVARQTVERAFTLSQP